MKKLLSISCIIIGIVCSFFVANAQVKVALGIKTGMNIANANLSPNNRNANSEALLGVLIGGVMEFKIDETFAVRFEPAFVQRGVIWHVPEQRDAAGNALGGKFDATWKNHYIEFPVVLRVRYNMGQFSPYFIAGPNLAVYLSSELTDVDEFKTEEEVGITDYIRTDFASRDLGFEFGAGMEYRITTTSIRCFVEANYLLGLINTVVPYERSHPDEMAFSLWDSWKTSDIKVAIGLMIDL
jgi:Outer membrane protein beta-barrel domain